MLYALGAWAVLPCGVIFFTSNRYYTCPDSGMHDLRAGQP